jgi:hypothetical protein
MWNDSQAGSAMDDNDSSPLFGSFLVKDADTNPVQKFRWVNTGSISDCYGNDRAGYNANNVPLPSECKATTTGLAAICWDQITYVNSSATGPFCTYKSLTPKACVGSAYPGVVYECQSVKASNQTNLIDFTYGTGAGSFELGNFLDNGYGYMGLAPGTTTITGWTVGGPGNGVDWVGKPFAVNTGSRAIDLINSSAGSVSTVIPTVTGQLYELSFYATTVSTGNALGTVSAGSVVNQSFVAPKTSGRDFANLVFGRFSFLFTATGSSTTVNFASTPNGSSCLPDCFGPEIDNVSVVAASEYFGGTLKTPASYEFTLEQNNKKTEAIQLINPGSIARSATLEIVNPQSGLTVAATQPNPISIAPGETKSLSLTIDDGSLPVGVYDGLLLKVTGDDGSTLYSSIKVNVVAQGALNLPDLTLSSVDIGFAMTNPGDPVTLTPTIRNQGKSPAANVVVRFFEFGVLLGETVIPQVAANGNTNTSIVVPMDATGDHLIRVVIDPDGAIQELDETNNEAGQIIQPGGSGPAATEGNILVSGSLPSTVYTNSLFTLSGRAVYDLLVNGARNTDYVVKGGSVQITVTGDGGTKWVYGDVHTDLNGNLAKSLQATTTPGTYHIAMTVTDQTFRGTRELVFSVVSPPLPHCLQFPLPSDCKPIEFLDYHQDPIDWPYLIKALYRLWQYTCPNNQCPPGAELFLPDNVYIYSEDMHFSKNNPAANEGYQLKTGHPVTSMG